jgi:deoxyadenosine/deoxycytidine kinase
MNLNMLNASGMYFILRNQRLEIKKSELSERINKRDRSCEKLNFLAIKLKSYYHKAYRFLTNHNAVSDMPGEAW